MTRAKRAESIRRRISGRKRGPSPIYQLFSGGKAPALEFRAVTAPICCAARNFSCKGIFPAFGRRGRIVAMFRRGWRSLLKGLLILCAVVVFAAGWFVIRSPDPEYAAYETLFHTRFHRYDAIIQEIATKRGVDPMVIKAVAWRESRFQADKEGSQGERGLMQITDAAAREWVKSEKVANFAPEDLFDPKTNIEAGSWAAGPGIAPLRRPRQPATLRAGRVQCRSQPGHPLERREEQPGWQPGQREQPRTRCQHHLSRHEELHRNRTEPGAVLPSARQPLTPGVKCGPNFRRLERTGARQPGFTPGVVVFRAASRRIERALPQAPGRGR